VLALQALSEFASLVYSPQSAGDVTVTFSGRGLRQRRRSLVVNSSNRLLLQTEAPITLPTSLHYSLTGTGCALIQVRQYEETSTTTLSCREPGMVMIHFWLPGGVRRRPQRVTFAGSGGRRDTLRPPPLLLRPMPILALCTLVNSYFGFPYSCIQSPGTYVIRTCIFSRPLSRCSPPPLWGLAASTALQWV